MRKVKIQYAIPREEIDLTEETKNDSAIIHINTYGWREFEVKQSEVKNAGLGVFAKRHLPLGARLPSPKNFPIWTIHGLKTCQMLFN